MTSGIPISEEALAALASAAFAAGFRPNAVPQDTAPQGVPVAPRGSVPDTTAAASLASAAAGLAEVPGSPVLAAPPTGLASLPTSPGPDPTAPQLVPVAPRGEMPNTTSLTSLATTATGLHTTPGSVDTGLTGLAAPDFTQFAVPDGIVPTVPGVLAGTAPQAPPVPDVPAAADLPAVPAAPAVPGVPGFPLDASPSVPALTAPEAFAVPAAPTFFHQIPGLTAAAPGDEANYYFTSARVLSEPVPQLADDHEIFDVHTLRADFPILGETVHGKPLIWFDNAATTQKPQAVIDRLAYFYAHENSNIHRAAHELAARATDAYEEARDTVRRFIGAPKDENIVFVRGTTEAINLVAHSWGAKNLEPGDEIVITNLEHHANIVPWQMISKKTGAVLKMAPVDDRGNLLMGEFEDLLGPRTKIVAATHLSNALGTVTPVHDIVAMGHRYGARVLIDGAQSVPHVPIDVAGCGADFFVFSGHKIFGPTGIGVLYATDEAMAETPPWQGGGNMIADVTLERSIFQGPPNKYEAGTGNIADAVGLGEALRYVEKVGVERIAAYEHALLDYATPRLAAIPGVRIIGTADHKASVLSFVLAGHDPIEVGKELNTEGIAVRAGHHCAMPILRRMGVETTVRPSFAFYNTVEEIDVFLRAVRRIAEGGPLKTPPGADQAERRGCAG